MLLTERQTAKQTITKSQSDLAKAAPNDSRTVKPSRAARVTDWRRDTAHIGNNSLHLRHSRQPKNLKIYDHKAIQIRLGKSYNMQLIIVKMCLMQLKLITVITFCLQTK